MFTFFLPISSSTNHVSLMSPVSVHIISLDVTLTCIKNRRRRHTHTLYHPFTLFLSLSLSSFGCHLVTLKMYRPKLMICVRVSCGSSRTLREDQTGKVMMLHHNELYSFRYVLVHTANGSTQKPLRTRNEQFGVVAHALITWVCSSSLCSVLSQAVKRARRQQNNLMTKTCSE